MRISILFFGFLGSLAWASEGPRDLLKAFPSEILRNEVVEFTPKADHHFSLEAPQKCAGRGPVEATARNIKCQFTSAGKAEAVLNVCDDKKTFCKPVSLALLVAERASQEPVRLVKNQGLNKDLKKEMVPGFVFATPEEAKKEALRLGKPVLVMVSTDWCPPCNESKEYLLKSEMVLDEMKDWYKIYVDGDSLGAAEWDKVVPFRFYPSYIVLNSKMEEVSRYSGKLRESEFVGWLRSSAIWLNEPIREVRRRVLARHTGGYWQRIIDTWNGQRNGGRRLDRTRMLAYALTQEDREMVDIILYKSDFHPPELKAQSLNYQIEKLADSDKPADKEIRRKIFEELLHHNLQKEDWAEALTRFCELDEKECKALAVNIPIRMEILNSRISLTPAERASMFADEYYYLAQLFRRVKEPEKEKEFALKCAKAFEELRALSKMKLSRSAQQGLVPCLEQAGKVQEAEKILKSLVEMYPYEPTFMLRMARLHRKQKKLDLALSWVKKAESVAYGYNWFSLVLLKSDILLDLNKKREAKLTLNSALSELSLDEDRASRNQTIVARLRAAEAKISN